MGKIKLGQLKNITPNIVLGSGDGGEIKEFVLGASLGVSGDTIVFTGATNDKPTLFKTFTLESPTNSDNITIFRTDVAITVQEVIAVSVGTTPSTTYKLKWGSDRSSAGTDLTTSVTTTSISTGDIATLGTAEVLAESWVWFESSAVGGTNVTLSVDIRYTED